MQEYIQEFVDHFDIRKHMQLQTDVRSLSPRSDGQRGWTFTLRDVKTGKETKQVPLLMFIRCCPPLFYGFYAMRVKTCWLCLRFRRVLFAFFWLLPLQKFCLILIIFNMLTFYTKIRINSVLFLSYLTCSRLIMISRISLHGDMISPA